MGKHSVFEVIEDERDALIDLSTRIWENPELSLQEEEAAESLSATLERAGFNVTRGVGGMPTAFVARYGEGDPRIGILGEYDALPGMSQRIATTREEITRGAPGHGCGHNLFGVACLGAAIAVKNAIDRDEVDGSIVYFGCPAEELLVGKVYMARAGVFDDLDAAVTWHPWDVTRPDRSSFLAMDSVRFEFTGQAAHAAGAPETGRSALDAVQLLNTGVEYMREHVADGVSVHYTIVNAGDVPNVVPASATGWYYIRAPTRSTVDRVSSWLDDIAEGAALMTQTDHAKRVISKCYDYVPNTVVTDIIAENMWEIGSIDYADADLAFASELQVSIAEARIENRCNAFPEPHRSDAREAALYSEPLEDTGDTPNAASTDVGDVSQITPTGQFRVATWPVGTPPHSWQAVAANGEMGMKGMINAAKILAATTYDLLADEARLNDAKEEFQRTVGFDDYECALPADTEPPFDCHPR